MLRSGSCSSRAGTQDLCLHDWAELFPALTRRPGALTGPGEGFPAQAAAGGNEARLPQAGHSGPAGGAASTPRGELFLSSARREDFSERLIRDPGWVSETWTGSDERGEGSEDWYFRQCRSAHREQRLSCFSVRENLHPLEPKQCTPMEMQKHFPRCGFAPTKVQA